LKLTSLLAVSQVLDMLRVTSSRVSPALKATGWLSGDLECCAPATGRFESEKVTLAVGDARALVDEGVSAELARGDLTFAPAALDLGGPQPAILTGHIDRDGYGMRLSGTVLRTQLMQLAQALPQFGDGLEAALPEAVDAEVEVPIRVDLASTRSWAGGQTWEAAAVKPVKAPRHSRRAAQ